MDGSDCLASGLCSFSSPEVRRDSGGDIKPDSAPDTELAFVDWWLLNEGGGQGNRYDGLTMVTAECVLW